MADEIEIMARDGIETSNMVYAGDVPWHGRGMSLNVTDNASLDAALALCPILNTTISHRKLYVNTKDGKETVVPGSYAAIRDYDEKVLGIVGEQQRQAKANPRRLLESLQSIVGPNQACLHTAMFLREGRVFVATAKLGAPIEITSQSGVKDETVFYLVGAMAFDGSMRTSLYETIVRTVCQNTLRRGRAEAVENDREFTNIKNTKSHEAKLRRAEINWARQVKKYELFKDQVTAMAMTKVSDTKALAVFRAAFDIKPDEVDASTRTVNNLETVINLYHGGKGNAPWTGTAWGVLNAITEYADHNMTVRGVRGADGMIDTSPEAYNKVTDSILFGAAADFKQVGVRALANVTGLSL